MNVILFLFFIICAHTFCITVGFSPNVRDFAAFDTDGVEKTIRNKCVTDDNIEQFQRAFYEFEMCMHWSLPKNYEAFNASEDLSDYCNHLKEGQFRTCIKNFTTNISPCLTQNESYIPHFLLNAFDVAYEELCGFNGVSNLQYVQNKINQTSKCMEMYSDLFYTYGSCTSYLNIFKNLDRGLLNLNKQDACLDLESFQKCTTIVLESVCSEEYSRFTDLLFRPFLENCNNLN